MSRSNREGVDALELAACRSLVRRLNGHIRAEIPPGGGVCVGVARRRALRAARTGVREPRGTGRRGRLRAEGDRPAPVKEFNPEIHRAYHAIEAASKEKLFALIPDPLKPGYEPFFRPDPRDRAHRDLVKAADKLCAYLKCLEETGAGNPEFAQAEKALRASVEGLDLPEVRYFIETFVPSFRLTLDELN